MTDKDETATGLATGAASGPAPDRTLQVAGETRHRRVPLWLLALFVVLVAVAAIAAWITLGQQAQRVESIEDHAADPVVPSEPVREEQLPENPVNFTSLKQENPDIYAWLSIPSCDINEPILQSLVDDNFYLNHDRYGDANDFGSVYTQRANNTDFSDPVTVVYGHVSHVSDIMFSNLHNFEDPAFFEENPTMYIYRPGHILTYEIIAAYKYDDRHILNSFDLSDPEVLAEYQQSVLSPESLVSNVRDGVELSADDKLVQLSTCMLDEYHGPSRYIVTGVLRDDQPTK